MLGAFQIYRQLKEYGEGESSYTEIEQYVWVDEAPEDSGDEEQNGSQSGEGEPDLRWPAVDFDALSEINPDIVAWIYIEDTEINYPVVQGTDNQYYLKRLFNGKWNGSGCIFLDSRNSPDLSDRHSIIYGHHMKNGTMFSGLTEYKKQGFYEGHPVVLLMMSGLRFLPVMWQVFRRMRGKSRWDLTWSLGNGWKRQKNAPVLKVKSHRQSQTGL